MQLIHLEKSKKIEIEMYNLKSLSTQHVAPIKEPLYLSKESSTPEKKLICTKGTASSVVHSWIPQERTTLDSYSLYSDQPYRSNQVVTDFYRTLLDPYIGIHHMIGADIVDFQYHRLTASAGLSTRRPRHIQTDEIVIVPLRELPRDYAKMEIARYIQQAGGRKVYISELAERLRLDIELIMEIIEELETETRE